MSTPHPFGPFRAPHKTKRFWTLVVGIIIAVVLVAPLVQALLGIPQFSWHTRLVSGGITLLVFVPAAWLALRFGVIAWLALAAAVVIFAVWAQSHSR